MFDLSGPTAALFLILAIIVLGLGYVILAYNRLVKLRQRLLNGYSQIDVQLKRRHDLIPNLVETVKGYMQHEKSTLQGVVEARAKAVSALQYAGGQMGGADTSALLGLGQAETLLTGALTQLLGVIEQYPDLKAVESTARLMEELSSTENRVAFARQAYNDAVAVFNTACESFPTLLFAGMLGFSRASMLEFEGQAFKSAPQVNL